MSRKKLDGAIHLSLLAALVTLVLKTVAYFFTDSLGLLSDAMESIVNVAAAVAARLALGYSRRPVDSNHTYGHEKIEFFSSGLEGALVIGSAILIASYAITRLVVPHAPENLGVGLFLLMIASLVNAIVALRLLRLARRYQSIVLEANGKHLLTDVVTGLGVLAALGLIWMTGWTILDPIIALLVAFHIFWVGSQLVLRSFNGLMDHALPVEEQEQLREAIEAHLQPSMTYHALRTRSAGARRFIDFHLLVPGSMSVADAHIQTDQIETALRKVYPGIEITVHIEPIEDQSAWHDSELLRVEKPRNITLP